MSTFDLPLPALPSGREVLVLRHEPSVHLGGMEESLQAAGAAYRYVDLFAAAPPALPLDRAAGLVVLGGTMNVDQTEQFPFLAAELAWIREAIEREVPLLGICLGAQLMAKALGQPVYRHRLKEVGFYTLELLPAATDDRLFGAAPRGEGASPPLRATIRETVFQWHGDTFDLPAGATPLARTATCENQAFRVGPAAWAVQFHVEMTATLMEEWLSEPVFEKELSAMDQIDPARIRQQAVAQMLPMRRFSRQLLGRFAQLCVSGDASAPTA